MQFKSDVGYFKSWIVLLSLIPHGYSLICMTCNNMDCDSGGIEFNCTTSMVLMAHEFLAGLNPSLDIVAPSTGADEFACFKLNMGIVVDTGILMSVIENGCTFRQTKFCEGWEDDVMVHECSLCQTDGCNAKQPPISTNTTTEGSAVTPTTSNPSGSGSGVDVAGLAGRWLVIGAFSLLLLI